MSLCCSRSHELLYFFFFGPYHVREELFRGAQLRISQPRQGPAASHGSGISVWWPRQQIQHEAHPRHTSPSYPLRFSWLTSCWGVLVAPDPPWLRQLLCQALVLLCRQCSDQTSGLKKNSHCSFNPLLLLVQSLLNS